MVTNKTSHKRDNFDFPIVNFPFICSYIPAAAAYAVYTSHLSDIPEHVVFHLDFFNRELLLTRKLLIQGLLVVKLKSSLRKFYGRHHDMCSHYEISVSPMTTDMFRLS